MEAVSGSHTVIHFAGHAHVPETPEGVALAERTNVEGTERLAWACAKYGVERLVFISSALVLRGARDHNGHVGDDTVLAPTTAYSRTKARAEEVVRAIGDETGLGWIILRPPMVYGPGSPGNFQRLVKLVNSGIPLPLGNATAPKSFLYVDNLISAIEALLARPEVNNSRFTVCDTEITSTAGLIRLIAAALGRPPRLLPVPQYACHMLGRIFGKEQDVQRLFEPLHMSADGLLKCLNWLPPFSLDRGVRNSVLT